MEKVQNPSQNPLESTCVIQLPTHTNNACICVGPLGRPQSHDFQTENFGIKYKKSKENLEQYDHLNSRRTKAKAVCQQATRKLKITGEGEG
jgi:hypothetical protein